MRAIGHVSSFVSNTERQMMAFSILASVTAWVQPNAMRLTRSVQTRTLLLHSTRTTCTFQTMTDHFPLSCGTGRTGAITESWLKAAMLIILLKKMADGWKMASPSLVRSFGHWVFCYVLTRRKTSLTKDERDRRRLISE